MKIKPIIKGISTCLPGTSNICKSRGSGGTSSASYCYGLWLKHLTMLWREGMNDMPDVIAELGPGGSIGVGLAALLTGARRYYALDAVEYGDTAVSLRVLDELVALFKRRAPRPTRGWPDFDSYLNDALFPDHILTRERLEAAMQPARIAAIRKAIQGDRPNTYGIVVGYLAPWIDPDIIPRKSVDLIISHSVLEHVNDLDSIYSACSMWIKSQGWMSHQIDLTSHGTANAWNGHWAYPRWLWRLILGKRPFLINRQPYSMHRNLLKRFGFNIVGELTKIRADGIRRGQLAAEWKRLSDDDFSCAGAYLVARKHREESYNLA